MEKKYEGEKTEHQSSRTVTSGGGSPEIQVQEM